MNGFPRGPEERIVVGMEISSGGAILVRECGDGDEIGKRNRCYREEDITEVRSWTLQGFEGPGLRPPSRNATEQTTTKTSKGLNAQNDSFWILSTVLQKAKCDLLYFFACLMGLH